MLNFVNSFDGTLSHLITIHITAVNSQQHIVINNNMKFRKIATALLLTAVLAAIMPQQAVARGHEKVFGVKTGWISRNESALAGLYFQYRFTDHFRLAPEVDIAFRNKDRNALLINVDAHFPVNAGSRVEFYPLVGCNFSAWSLHTTVVQDEHSNDVTNRTSRFGLTAGAGLGVKVTPTLRLNFEARGTFVKSNNAALVTAGIGYVF